jgi:MoaA/NifB/PqqE/SkfB family radical SAM enzyme
MANLSITNVCNKSCVYCFANDTRNEYGKAHMEEGLYEKALDYLERSGIRQARLLGGEPTLHPAFISFVGKALNRGLSVMLFTNGLISDKVLEFLYSIPREKLSILLNTIQPEEKNEAGTRRQLEVMQKLGPVIIAGVNIYNARQELHYLLDYVNKFGLKKEIRMGISHSVLSMVNIYLHPKEYPKIGQKIAKFKLDAKKSGISLGFDCGFVPCMFPQEHYELLADELVKAGTCCHPIIDLLSDGSFISCYPLNNLTKIKIHDELQAGDLIGKFEEALTSYKTIGIYPYCSSCPLFNNRCNGGCLSFRIQRFYNPIAGHGKAVEKGQAL